MSRLSENADVREYLKGLADKDSNSQSDKSVTNFFLLHVATALLDISKSLAIIADSLTAEGDNENDN